MHCHLNPRIQPQFHADNCNVPYHDNVECEFSQQVPNYPEFPQPRSSGSPTSYFSNRMLPVACNHCVEPHLHQQYMQQLPNSRSITRQNTQSNLALQPLPHGTNTRPNYSPEDVVNISTTLAAAQVKMFELISKIQDRLPTDSAVPTSTSSSNANPPVNPLLSGLNPFKKGLAQLVPQDLLPFKLEYSMTTDVKIERILIISAVCNAALNDNHVTSVTFLSQFLLIS